jgi:fatty-acyl-CoA synthase
LIVDREWAAVARAALADLPDPRAGGDRRSGGRGTGRNARRIDYEAFLACGDPDAPGRTPADEWESIALSYTSGTTGDPKGVVTHHRGAYLNACGNALAFGLNPESVYLWTLPMFHCNGWTYTWAVTLQGGTHVCLRRVEPAAIFAAVAEHGVTHLCAAPVVLTMLIHAPAEQTAGFPADLPHRHRRRGAALGGDRGHGEAGLRGDAPLRAHRVLRPGHHLRAAAGAGRAAPGGARGRSWRGQGVNHPTLEEATVLDTATMRRCRRTAGRWARWRCAGTR